MKAIEPFVIKHYTGDDFPSIKGNGLYMHLATEREDAEEYAEHLNKLLAFSKSNEAETVRRLRDIQDDIRKQLESKPDADRTSEECLSIVQAHLESCISKILEAEGL